MTVDKFEKKWGQTVACSDYRPQVLMSQKTGSIVYLQKILSEFLETQGPQERYEIDIKINKRRKPKRDNIKKGFHFLWSYEVCSQHLFTQAGFM